MIHAVKKRLIYDTIDLKQKPDILCNNDAKYYYYHIVNSVAIITMQLLLMPAHPIKYMLVMLQDLEHRIRTAYSAS